METKMSYLKTSTGVSPSKTTDEMKNYIFDAKEEDAGDIPGFLVSFSSDKHCAEYFAVESPYTIGRVSSPKFAIDDGKLSQSHCRIYTRNNRWFIEDLGSKNGTFLNGLRIPERRILSHGDVVRIGSSLLVFSRDIRPYTEAVGNYPFVSRFFSKMLIPELKRALAEDRPILIAGPTGSGKELVARTLVSIINEDKKRMIPFVAHNAARFSGNDEALTTLFGVTKNTFTNVTARPGLIELADGGVLFLDEFHNLSYELQKSLLRIVDDGLYSRFGETLQHKVNVQFVFASNEPPPSFSLAHDVLSRQRVVRLPELGERKADIPVIFNFLLGEELDRLGIDKQMVFSALHVLHYEALSLFGFRKDNVRGLSHFASRMAGYIYYGKAPNQAFGITQVELKREECSIDTLARDRSFESDSMSRTKDPDFSDIYTPNRSDRVSRKYQHNRDLIERSFVSCKGNVARMVRELRDQGLTLDRHTLSKYVFEIWKL